MQNYNVELASLFFARLSLDASFIFVGAEDFGKFRVGKEFFTNFLCPLITEVKI